MKPVEEAPFDHAARWILMALQVSAMALSACILANMYLEDTLAIPHHVCIQGAPVPDLQSALAPQ
jgi:hypothetical protein